MLEGFEEKEAGCGEGRMTAEEPIISFSVAVTTRAELGRFFSFRWDRLRTRVASSAAGGDWAGLATVFSPGAAALCCEFLNSASSSAERTSSDTSSGGWSDGTDGRTRRLGCSEDDMSDDTFSEASEVDPFTCYNNTRK